MIRKRAYDVSELGLTYFLRTIDGPDNSPFLAIPVFPNRCFRYSASTYRPRCSPALTR